MSDIAKLVVDQRNFSREQGIKRLEDRRKILRKLFSVLKDNEKLLEEAIQKDFSKSAFEVKTTELFLVYDELTTALKKLKVWAKPKRVKTNLPNLPASSFIVPEPLGHVLIIGAWNYPYQLSLIPAISALCAGNSVIIKPSELPQATSEILKRIINENFDSRVFTVVEGGVEETTELLKQRFDKIFFTGSTTVGKIVYQAAAQTLTPVTLELGGKSPAIISETADLKLTVQRLVWAKYLNAGQTCIAPDYVLVNEVIYEEFIDAIIKEIKKRSYKLESGNFVQIINDRNLERLSKLIDLDKVVLGGKIDKFNRLVEPTVMKDIVLEDKIMKEEIFGPIMPIIKYSSWQEMLDIVGSFEKPLAAYLFSRSKMEHESFIKNISFGGGTINDAVMHISNPHLPFGGVGHSGFGNYHNEAGFKCFSHYKSILKRSNLIEFSLKYAPYSKRKLNWIKWFLGV